MGKRRSLVLSAVCAALILLGAMPALAIPAGQGDDESECEDGWASLASEVFPGRFKVWASCTGDYEDALLEMRDIVDSFWGEMTAFMGVEPVPDDGSDAAGGDTAIDFYLLNSDEVVPGRRFNPPDLGAYAADVPPQIGVTSAGAVVCRREYVGEPFFYFILVHEFFHVLQKARNAELAFNWATRPDDDPEWDTLVEAEHWWTEATATWAAFHFTRDMPEEDQTRRVEHRGWFDYYLATSVDIPLHAPQQKNEPGWFFMYSTYIWFFYMEQEVGAEAIAEIWEEFAEIGPNDFEEAMAIIDARLPFEQYFREFAVRNLNLDMEPGDPINPDYDDLDPAFPTRARHSNAAFLQRFAVMPPLIVGEDDDAELPLVDEDDEPRRFTDRIRSLTAHYYRLEPDSRGGQLILDFSGLESADDLDVDAIVKIEDGDWERRRLSAGGEATFCLSEPEEEIEELYLILSNHNRDLYSIVEGEFTAQVLDEDCEDD